VSLLVAEEWHPQVELAAAALSDYAILLSAFRKKSQTVRKSTANNLDDHPSSPEDDGGY
jgi:hypothetical protein